MSDFGLLWKSLFMLCLVLWELLLSDTYPYCSIMLGTIAIGNPHSPFSYQLCFGTENHSPGQELQPHGPEEEYGNTGCLCIFTYNSSQSHVPWQILEGAI